MLLINPTLRKGDGDGCYVCVTIISLLHQHAGAISEELGLIAWPKSDGIVQLLQIENGASIGCELEIRHDDAATINSRGALHSKQQLGVLLQACWGSAAINPTILALSYSTAVVLWSITQRGKQITKSLGCIIHPPKKTRLIGWHPTSIACLLAISSVADITIYQTSHITAPVALYTIPSPSGATLESWAWDR